MISFRFHVVSITAIFLAIAIGVVVGSTYIDRLTVDRLERQIRTVEDNVTEVRDENARLEDELNRAQDYIDLSADFAVTDRLIDVPLLVVASRGVDEAAVERTVALARRAGGAVPGVAWLEPSWVLDSDEALEAMAAAVDEPSTSDPEELWAAAWSDIASDLIAPEEEAIPTGEAPTAGSGDGSVLEELEAAGFITVDSLDDDSVTMADLESVDPRVLFITGPQAADELVPMLPVAVDAIVGGGLLTSLGDVHVTDPDGPGRGAELLESLDESLVDAIVVIDSLDLEEGRVAAVLAIDAAADGQVGVHYGYGEDADAVLPAWTTP